MNLLSYFIKDLLKHILNYHIVSNFILPILRFDNIIILMCVCVIIYYDAAKVFRYDTFAVNISQFVDFWPNPNKNTRKNPFEG